MAWTIDKALEDESITVISRDDIRGDYELRIGDLDTPVHIKLRRHVGSDETDFEVSHAIKTTGMPGPYRTSIRRGDYPAYALHRAIMGITDHFRTAIKEGHRPQESWLIEND